MAGAGVFEGMDDRGVIRVTVDRSCLVADVAVPPAWRDTVGPRELGRALLTAANRALFNHLADALDRVERDPHVLPTDAVVLAGLFPRDLATSEVADLLNRFDRDVEVYRARLEAAVNVTATASGPNGRVTVTMTQRCVTPSLMKLRELSEACGRGTVR